MPETSAPATRQALMRKWLVRALALLAFTALVVGIALLVMRLQRPPAGPVDIAWDREPCAQCRMLIGDPAFAAQIQTTDGRILDFDDPGCLLKYEAERKPAVRATYFRQVNAAGWLPGDRVAFLPVPHSPMGYDLGAVPLGTPGAISIDEARARVLGPAPRAERQGAEPHGAP